MLDRKDSGSNSRDSIAIIGTGPRGISVIERLAANLYEKKASRPLTIYAIDEVEVGCGRIWRSDQPAWFLMNTRSKDVTMFPGSASSESWKPGSGPTFLEWLHQTKTEYLDPSGYAPRVMYGRYLKFVLDTVEMNLPDHVKLVRVNRRATHVKENQNKFEISFDGMQITADRVVLCTGHPDSVGEPGKCGSSEFRIVPANGMFIQRNSPANMPLSRVSKNHTVGIIGLGLAFYDVLAALTVGRGGRFVQAGTELKYVRSGEEPELIVAGSRRGVPITVRGIDDRPVDFAYKPYFVTVERIERLRRRGPLCFRSEILPWINAEINLVYIQQLIDAESYDRFCREISSTAPSSCDVMQTMSKLAEKFGVGDVLDIDSLIDPFKGIYFEDQNEFRERIINFVEDDVRHAEAGEFRGPIKAALNVLRDIRPLIRKAVDLGGLTEASHREFVKTIGPNIMFLSTGPSHIKAKQLLALLRVGLLDIVGPEACFETNDTGRFTAHSRRTAKHSVDLDVLIDARTTDPNITLDRNPLLRSFAGEGMLRDHRELGGIDVTDAPFYPLNSDGVAQTRLHVLGIPTEFTRWFMHVGVGQPGSWDEFFRDADTIALALLEDV